MDILVAALVLTLGLVLGYGARAVRGLRQEARRRAREGAFASLATIWPDTLPVRSPSDVLAGVIRVRLGGEVYELPVLPRRQAAAWLASVDAQYAGMADALSSAETPEILMMLAADTVRLYDLLLDYDVTGQLPPRDSDTDNATEAEILRAILEVWAALHPLAVALVARQRARSTSNGNWPESPTPSPSPMAGVPGPSLTN